MSRKTKIRNNRSKKKIKIKMVKMLLKKAIQL